MCGRMKDRIALLGCGCLTFAVGMVVIGLVSGSGSKNEKPPAPPVVVSAAAAAASSSPVTVARAPTPPEVPAAAAEPPGKEWYLGGTLHDAGALEWQTATPEDRLATCADLVVRMKESGHLKSSMAGRLKSVDDVRLPAVQLMVAIDKATASEPDPVKNRQLFVNQKVSSLAALNAALMGWLE